MNERPVERAELLGSLPPPRAAGPLTQIQELVRVLGRKLIVLDDDPTGTQTVHGVPVVTRWGVECIARELADPSPVSYVLTNSRSLAAPDAARLAREVGASIRAASERTGRDVSVVSRSDSTLRGHFPAEVDALREALGLPYRAVVLVPFFAAGGRLTVRDVHYVAEGSLLVPAALTPFARDPAFGYRSSNLLEWVEEKTGGRIRAGDVRSVSIDDLRLGGAKRVRELLRRLEPGSVVVANAAEERDVETLALSLLSEEVTGARFLYRTAASFVPAWAGLAPRDLLRADEIDAGNGRGVLVVVGSHVPRTTEQLGELLASRRVDSVELRVSEILEGRSRAKAVAVAAEHLDAVLRSGGEAVLYTSREVVGADASSSLSIAKRVSAAIVEVVRGISTRPRALIAKGGITSSDVATQALEVDRAIVLGQILPGVPVWRCGPESRFPGLPLVVFPGNVGDAAALRVTLERLAGLTPPRFASPRGGRSPRPSI